LTLLVVLTTLTLPCERDTDTELLCTVREEHNSAMSDVANAQ